MAAGGDTPQPGVLVWRLPISNAEGSAFDAIRKSVDILIEKGGYDWGDFPAEVANLIVAADFYGQLYENGLDTFISGGWDTSWGYVNTRHQADRIAACFKALDTPDAFRIFSAVQAYVEGGRFVIRNWQDSGERRRDAWIEEQDLLLGALTPPIPDLFEAYAKRLACVISLPPKRWETRMHVLIKADPNNDSRRAIKEDYHTRYQQARQRCERASARLAEMIGVKLKPNHSTEARLRQGESVKKALLLFLEAGEPIAYFEDAGIAYACRYPSGEILAQTDVPT